RDVGGVAVAARYPLQQKRQALDVAGHVQANNEPLFFHHQRRAAGVQAGEALVDLAEAAALGARAENAVQIMQEFVAGGALDRPVRRQLFVRAENFFDDQINVAGLAAQPLEIGQRIVETVHVIDPEAGDLAGGGQLENQFVRGAKNFFVLNPDRDQLVDVEKSPVIDLLRGDFPERQPIPLLRQQPVEQVEAFRVAFDAVEARDAGVEMIANGGRGAVKLPEHLLDETDLIGALGALLSGREIFERVDHAEKLDVVGLLRPEPASEGGQIAGQNVAVGFDVDRQGEREIADAQSLLVVAERDLALLQTLAVKRAEKRREDFAAHAFVGVLPVDVEKIAVARRRAVFQHVHQNFILAVVGHVVWHDVLHAAQAQAPRGGAQRGETGLAAELPIDAVRIDHVVAVAAAGARLKD